MPTSAALFLLCGLGLQDGWTPAPSTAPVSLTEEGEAAWRGGMVLDPLTGEGLPGIRVRVFEEDWYDPLEPLRPLVTVFTDASGAFTFRVDDPRFASAEKLLFDAPGRRSLETPLGEAFGETFLLEPETPLQVQVCDLWGRPLEGAVLKTTTTCSHAPPAWVARTSRHGLASLAAAPSIHEEGDLDVEAAGYQAREDLSVHDGWAWQAHVGAYTIFLAPQEPLRVQVIGQDGQPVSEGARIVRMSDGPWRVARIGPQGLATIHSPGGGRGESALWLAPARSMEPRAYLPGPYCPSGEVLTTRLGLSEVWPELPVIHRLSHTPWPAGLEVMAAGRDGLVDPPREGDAWILPPGPAAVHWGPPFQGFEPGSLQVDLDGDLEISPDLIRERPVDLSPLAEVEWVRVVIATESASRELDTLEAITAPANEPLTVFTELADGAAWVFPIAAGEGACALDPSLGTELRPALPPPASRPQVSLRVEPRSDDGQLLKEASVSLWAMGEWLDPSEGDDPGVFEASVPAGERIHLEVWGAGSLAWRNSLALLEETTLAVHLRSLARLTVTGAEGLVQVAGQTVLPTAGEAELELPPGQYELRLIRANGACERRTVKLDPGDHLEVEARASASAKDSR